MTTYIPRLARIASSRRPGRAHKDPADPRRANARVNVDLLAGILPQIRHRLGLSPQFSDEALLASLVAITRHPSHEGRWRAAEVSTLGQALAASGKDLRHALVTLLTLLPKPYL
jgi:hypothetical protein